MSMIYRGLFGMVLLQFALNDIQAQELRANKSVVEFCVRQLDKTVGNGECSTLATQALQSAGATSREADRPNSGDYVWGSPVYYLESTNTGFKTHGASTDLEPGDVIQFRNTNFKGNKRDGSGTYSITARHHTAVVYKVENQGKDLSILHQNFAGKRFVHETALYLDDLSQGWIRVYRPKAASGRNE